MCADISGCGWPQGNRIIGGWRLAELQAEPEAPCIVGPARTVQILRAELPHLRFLSVDEIAGDQTEAEATIEPIERRSGEVFAFQYPSGGVRPRDQAGVRVQQSGE
uniref:Uncharacterized protein n=1 Tax=Thermosporothrix sp. COM3 TaxID=2490863 RepID=A0A455SCY4_9CHLR|nr:hypothetical protein KTC_10640 [Thermosporothrix sp. COM3]